MTLACCPRLLSPQSRVLFLSCLVDRTGVSVAWREVGQVFGWQRQVRDIWDEA